MNTKAQTAELRDIAKKGIESANDTTLRRIIGLLDDQSIVSEDDSAYEKEINRRFDELETGRVKPISLDELEKRAIQNHVNLSRARK